MIDIDKLKALAEGASDWNETGRYHIEVRSSREGYFLATEADMKFIAAANPYAVLNLIEEIARLRKDAERYRWLRSKNQFMDAQVMILDIDSGNCVDNMDWLSGESLDVRIDSAIVEEQFK